MSRGNKEAAMGILKTSMRDNYAEHGVDEYYKKVGATYRNPHFPGVCNTLFLWLNKWWQHEHSRIETEGFIIFDMACDSGEVTVAIMEWWKVGRAAHTKTFEKGKTFAGDSVASAAVPRPVVLPRAKHNPYLPPPLGPDLIPPKLLAADPYTAEAFFSRTRLHCCSTLSFKEISDGQLPEKCLAADKPEEFDPRLNVSPLGPDTVVEMTVCSFALHLVESSSELFSLLWELSTKCRWLVVLAPHKKPEIKDGWGWTKWNVDAWSECDMSDAKGEFLQDRVHCRVYRSLNID